MFLCLFFCFILKKLHMYLLPRTFNLHLFLTVIFPGSENHLDLFLYEQLEIFFSISVFILILIYSQRSSVLFYINEMYQIYSFNLDCDVSLANFFQAAFLFNFHFLNFIHITQGSPTPGPQAAHETIPPPIHGKTCVHRTSPWSPKGWGPLI